MISSAGEDSIIFDTKASRKNEGIWGKVGVDHRDKAYEITDKTRSGANPEPYIATSNFDLTKLTCTGRGELVDVLFEQFIACINTIPVLST